jgi:cathepsin A (carboxypeptidase C)
MLVLACVFLAARLLQVAATQQTFFASPTSYGSKGAAYDAGLISPIEDLGALSVDEYTTLVHPAYPHHSVRIKQTSAGFCDDTVRSVLKSVLNHSHFLI